MNKPHTVLLLHTKQPVARTVWFSRWPHK